MKRAAVFCIFILFVMIIAGMSQTARDPDLFSGQWYSSLDQTVYLFEEGLIYCPKALSDSDFISGAYAYSRQSVFLFAAGIEGLETEKEVYLVQKDDGSFLCENKDGSGTVYFIRYHE